MTLLQSLKEIIKSSPDEGSAYQEWILESPQEELSKLSVKQWGQIAKILKKDDSWAEERYQSWLIEDEDEDDDEDEQE